MYAKMQFTREELTMLELGLRKLHFTSGSSLAILRQRLIDDVEEANADLRELEMENS